MVDLFCIKPADTAWEVNPTSILWWKMNFFGWIKIRTMLFTWDRMKDTFFTESQYLVSSVLGNDLVEVLINVHTLLSKKGKVWNTFCWRKPDQLLALYVSTLLLPKPKLLCFKRRLKQHKRHPKLHSKNIAKLTQALYFYLVCSTSLLWRPFSTSTPYMVLLHENLKFSQYFGPFKDILLTGLLVPQSANDKTQHLFYQKMSASCLCLGK